MVYQERDNDPPRDPKYGDEYVELESAWVGYFGANLATWLGVPYFDR